MQRGVLIRSLIGAESQVGGVVHSCWRAGLVDGSSWKIQQIAFLWRNKMIHLENKLF